MAVSTARFATIAGTRHIVRGRATGAVPVWSNLPAFGRRYSNVADSSIPGVTYCFGGVVYASLTNESSAGLTMLAANGPGFTFPPGTGFQPLPSDQEPTGAEAADAAVQACRRLDQEEGPRQDGREVVFAGLGEPLMRLPALLDALQQLKAQPRNLVRATRLNSNGLVASAEAARTAEQLKAAGVGSVCVQLQTACAEQHAAMVQPRDGLSFGDACAFVSALARVGVPCEVTAIARPDVDTEAVKSLALSQLGATRFKTRPYFP
eukprot:TRINITY_DN47108_c0_g1_i1.p1 TRINITY_DN47108_c0_g1~~TRINITY_DN47108_c0_g1_i1.p1  ORF type:complete len:264 (-),score=40.14 TRINITY_DN47108_c0_g1_i1:204-995(-)